MSLKWQQSKNSNKFLQLKMEYELIMLLCWSKCCYWVLHPCTSEQKITKKKRSKKAIRIRYQLLVCVVLFCLKKGHKTYRTTFYPKISGLLFIFGAMCAFSVAFSYLVHFIRFFPFECADRNYGFKTSLNNNNFWTNAHRV